MRHRELGSSRGELFVGPATFTRFLETFRQLFTRMSHTRTDKFARLTSVYSSQYILFSSFISHSASYLTTHHCKQVCKRLSKAERLLNDICQNLKLVTLSPTYTKVKDLCELTVVLPKYGCLIQEHSKVGYINQAKFSQI